MASARARRRAGCTPARTASRCATAASCGWSRQETSATTTGSLVFAACRSVRPLSLLESAFSNLTLPLVESANAILTLPLAHRLRRPPRRADRPPLHPLSLRLVRRRAPHHRRLLPARPPRAHSGRQSRPRPPPRLALPQRHPLAPRRPVDRSVAPARAVPRAERKDGRLGPDGPPRARRQRREPHQVAPRARKHRAVGHRLGRRPCCALSRRRRGKAARLGVRERLPQSRRGRGQVRRFLTLVRHAVRAEDAGSLETAPPCRHFTILSERLEQLGCTYGSLSVHNGASLSLAARPLLGADADAPPRLARRSVGVGDADVALAPLAPRHRRARARGARPRHEPDPDPQVPRRGRRADGEGARDRARRRDLCASCCSLSLARSLSRPPRADA